MEITNNTRAYISFLGACLLALPLLPPSASKAMMTASPESGAEEEPNGQVRHALSATFPHGQRLVRTVTAAKAPVFPVRRKTPGLPTEKRQGQKRPAEAEACSSSTFQSLLQKKADAEAASPPPLKRSHTSQKFPHPLLACAHYFGMLYDQDVLFWKKKGYGWYTADLAPFFYQVFHAAATTRIRNDQTFWGGMLKAYAPRVTYFERAAPLTTEAQTNLNQQMAQRKQGVLRTLFWTQINAGLSQYSMRFPDPSHIFMDISHLAMQYTHPENMAWDLDFYSLQGGRPFEVPAPGGATKVLREGEKDTKRRDTSGEDMSIAEILFDLTRTSPPARPVTPPKSRRHQL